MIDQIISREHIRERGAAAFEAGRGRDDHGMNWNAPAIVEWQDGWDRAYANWCHSGSATA